MAVYDVDGNVVSSGGSAVGAQTTPITDIEVGSLVTTTGAETAATNRFRSAYIPVWLGDSIRLTQFGAENGYGFNVFQYRSLSTFADCPPFIGNRGYSSADYTVSDLNCVFIRVTIGKAGVSDVTGMEADFAKALEIVPSIAKKYDSRYLFSKNLQTFERFFESETNYNQDAVTAAEMVSKFDALLGEHFTVAKTGTDSWGNTLKAYRWKPREKGYFNNHKIINATFTPFPFAKIMVVGNIHGTERSPAFSMLKLVELLTSDTYVNDSIDFIRNNVELVMVPVANPSGWDAKTYENGNNKNLNRDFPPYGAFSQKEAQFVRDVFNEIKDGLKFFFDFHNTWWDELNTTSYNRDNPTPMPQLGYVYTDNPMFQQIGCNIYSMFKSRVNDASASPVDYIVYCESSRKGTSALWAQSQGVEGTLFEIARKIPALSNTEWGNDVIIWGVNLLCAFICNSIYTLRLNN